MPEIKLSGFGKRNIPMFSYEFYKSAVPIGTTRVVLKESFYEIHPATDIASWLEESASSNVTCCRFVPSGRVEPNCYNGWSSEPKTTAAIYFDDINDVIMFKMAYHEIIEEHYTKTTLPGEVTSLDVNEIRKHLLAKGAR